MGDYRYDGGWTRIVMSNLVGLMQGALTVNQAVHIAARESSVG